MKQEIKKEYFFTVSLFLSSILIRFLIADFPKSFVVYDDEILYTQIAQSLIQGRGILVRSIPTNFQTVLYSLLIAPAYLLKQSEVTITAISFLNCIMMSAVVFPAYGLAKRISNNSITKYTTTLVIMMMSEFTFTITFMSENLYFFLMIMTLYLMVRSFEETGKKRYVYSIVIAIMAYAIYYGKTIGLYLVAAYAILLAIEFFQAVILKNEKWKQVFISGCIFVICFLGLYYFTKIAFFANAGSNYDAAVARTFGGIFSNILFGLKSYFNILAFALVSFFYLPVIYPFFYYKKLNPLMKKTYILSVMSLFIAILVIIIMITVPEELGKSELRQHLRYLFPLFVPFIIVTTDILLNQIKVREKNTKADNIKILFFTFTFLIIVIVNCNGLFTGSHVDQTSLKYYQYLLVLRNSVIKTASFDAILIGLKLIIAFVIVYFTICILCKKQKLMLISLMILTVGVNIINTILTTVDFKKEYSRITVSADLNEINRLNRFIDNTDDNVMLLYNIPYSRTKKLVDTYVYQRDNLICSTPLYVGVNSKDDIYQIREKGIPVQGVLGKDGSLPVKNIKYIVTFGVSAELQNVEKLDNWQEDLFQIYENKNTESLSISENGIFPLNTGEVRSIGSDELLFETSGIWKDGEYISTEKDQWLLYGPYCNIAPGTYNIKFYYDYDDNKDEPEKIGTVSISMPENFETQWSDFYSSEKMVEIPEIKVMSQNNNVELKMSVRKPGIRVTKVEIEKIGD